MYSNLKIDKFGAFLRKSLTIPWANLSNTEKMLEITRFKAKHHFIQITIKDTSIAAPGALAHRLQHLTARFIQNGRQGPELGQTLGY